MLGPDQVWKTNRKFSNVPKKGGARPWTGLGRCKTEWRATFRGTTGRRAVFTRSMTLALLLTIAGRMPMRDSVL